MQHWIAVSVEFDAPAALPLQPEPPYLSDRSLRVPQDGMERDEDFSPQLVITPRLLVCLANTVVGIPTEPSGTTV